MVAISWTAQSSNSGRVSEKHTSIKRLSGSELVDDLNATRCRRKSTSEASYSVSKGGWSTAEGVGRSEKLLLSRLDIVSGGVGERRSRSHGIRHRGTGWTVQAWSSAGGRHYGGR